MGNEIIIKIATVNPFYSALLAKMMLYLKGNFWLLLGFFSNGYSRYIESTHII